MKFGMGNQISPASVPALQLNLLKIMKKSLTSLATLAFAGLASAQSTVTLFGVIDADISHYSQGGLSKTLMSTSGNGPSSLGFRGTEDLGGGMTAGFWLEAALLNDTGAYAGSVLFGRRSTVSLATDYGEVRLGRDAPPSWWNNVVFDPFGGAGPAGGTNITKGGGSNGFNGTSPLAFTRINNSIQYLWGFAPNAQTAIGSGIYAQLTYAFPENISGTPAIAQYAGGRLGYTAGPMNVAVSYATSKGAPLPGERGLYSKFKDFNLGGAYKVGPVNLMAHFGINDSDVAGTKYTHWGAGAMIDAGAGYIPISYNVTKQNDTASDGAHQIAVGYVYYLSKRTTVYTALSHIQNKNNGTYTFLGGNGGGSPGLETAFGGGRTFGSGTGYDVGMRTSF